MPFFGQKYSFFSSSVFLLLIGIFILASSILPSIQIKAASEIKNFVISNTQIPLIFSHIPPKTIKVVLYGKKEKNYLSQALTIKQFLLENNIILNEQDLLSSNTYNTLTSKTIIYVDRFDTMNTITYKPINFATKYTYTQDLPQDTKKTLQKGSMGIQKKITQKKFKNGVVLSEKILTEHTYKAPQNEQIALGTRKEYQTITINGNTFQYHKILRVWGTSYDYTCLGCNHYTATGSYLDVGTIAVDPKVIPLYTKMYVPGYGFGQALDVGGGIKGNKIDLGFDDLSKHQGEWSARWVDIYLLD